MPKNIFIVSGEASGDMHGAALMRALQRLEPGIKTSGMGGPRMRDAGLVGLDSKEVSVVGITEVVGRLPWILKSFSVLKKMLAGEKFDAVVLIDFPDFNLRFAKAAKKIGVPIIYYISPQIWAWRKGRIKQIAALVDKMLVIFPFEAGLYKDAGVDVEYVGHPLYTSAVCPLTREEARRKFGLEMNGAVVALVPGSRPAEIKRLLPIMAASAPIIEERLKKKASFILPAADTIDDELINRILRNSAVTIKILRGDTYAALRASDAAMTASGTVTLETALIGTPMVIVYKMSSLTFKIAQRLISVENIGLPNIVAGRRVVKELLQDDVTPQNVASAVTDIICDSRLRNDIISGYDEIRKKLAPAGAEPAVDRAATAIMQVIKRDGRDKRQR